MKEKQALEIIKAILDEATKKGIFNKMDDAFTAITAFNLIAAKFENEPVKDADAK